MGILTSLIIYYVERLQPNFTFAHVSVLISVQGMHHFPEAGGGIYVMTGVDLVFLRAENVARCCDWSTSPSLHSLSLPSLDDGSVKDNVLLTLLPSLS